MFIICIHFNLQIFYSQKLQIYDNDNSDNDDSLEFWDMVLGAAKLAENMWSHILIKIHKR
jgi:hypothetical protein